MASFTGRIGPGNRATLEIGLVARSLLGGEGFSTTSISKEEQLQTLLRGGELPERWPSRSESLLPPLLLSGVGAVKGMGDSAVFLQGFFLHGALAAIVFLGFVRWGGAFLAAVSALVVASNGELLLGALTGRSSGLSVLFITGGFFLLFAAGSRSSPDEKKWEWMGWIGGGASLGLAWSIDSVFAVFGLVAAVWAGFPRLREVEGRGRVEIRSPILVVGAALVVVSLTGWVRVRAGGEERGNPRIEREDDARYAERGEPRVESWVDLVVEERRQAQRREERSKPNEKPNGEQATVSEVGGWGSAVVGSMGEVLFLDGLWLLPAFSLLACFVSVLPGSRGFAGLLTTLALGSILLGPKTDGTDRILSSLLPVFVGISVAVVGRALSSFLEGRGLAIAVLLLGALGAGIPSTVSRLIEGMGEDAIEGRDFEFLARETGTREILISDRAAFVSWMTGRRTVELSLFRGEVLTEAGLREWLGDNGADSVRGVFLSGPFAAENRRWIASTLDVKGARSWLKGRKTFLDGAIFYSRGAEPSEDD